MFDPNFIALVQQGFVPQAVVMFHPDGRYQTWVRVNANQGLVESACRETAGRLWLERQMEQRPQ